MKLVSIVPVADITHTFDGPYAMMLTHLAEADYYPECKNPNCYKILDNSLIELGGAVDIDRVLAAAYKIKADEIILPDMFRDGIRSYELAEKYSKELHERNIPFRMMAVCHGRTKEEFEECFHKLEKLPYIHCIGIPKVSEELTPTGRPGLEYLWANSTKTIHLLGCWTNMHELIEYKNPQKIRSCDTCIPALNSNYNLGAFDDRPHKTIDLVKDKINWPEYDKIIDTMRKYHLIGE